MSVEMQMVRDLVGAPCLSQSDNEISAAFEMGMDFADRFPNVAAALLGKLPSRSDPQPDYGYIIGHWTQLVNEYGKSQNAGTATE